MATRRSRFGALLMMLVVGPCLGIGRTAARAEVDSGFVPVDGGRVFYEAAGSGPEVLLLHDGLLHRETWDAQFALLASSHRVVRWDRRGYGRSDAAKAPYSNMDDMLAVMKALKIERAAVVGCSAGSLVAVHFALEHPEMVSSLVLVGPIVSGFDFSEHFLTRGGRWRPTADTRTEEKIEYWTSRDPWFIGPENGAARRRARAILEANPGNVSVPGNLMRWAGGPAFGRLSAIKVPTTIVVGEGDIPDVHAHAGALQSGIAGSTRRVIARSGHLPHMEAPEEFNRVLLEALGKPK
jgi:pimeloyl-ACP methyl ester carboxylesterase